MEERRFGRPIRRRDVLRGLGLGAGAAAFLAACGGGGSTPKTGTSTPGAAGRPAGVAGLPSYYPSSYNDIVEASKKESGLVVYSIMSKTNWQPVLDDFKKLYGWIDVDAGDLDSATIFDKYYSESAGNVRTADMIITSSPDAWQDFIKKGEVQEYKSPEDDKMPSWSKLASGVYTVSSDPMVFIWNKKLLTTPPKTMAELGDMAAKDPGKFTSGKITSYEETNATGFAGN